MEIWLRQGYGRHTWGVFVRRTGGPTGPPEPSGPRAGPGDGPPDASWGIADTPGVEASDHPDWKPGDAVLVNGYGLGERHWGGLAQRARVKGEWLVPLPAAFTPRQAMASLKASPGPAAGISSQGPLSAGDTEKIRVV